MQNLLIVSGRSGSGKSSALNILEDLGYYCVDNLPVNLLDAFVHSVADSKQNVAVSIDIRNIPKKLKELIETGRINIVPQKRRNEMLSFIESGLEDVSISRPKSQLSWGIEVPDDSEHVMYVWFDALTNYISAIGYENDSEKFQKYWPANVHVIGKDIARFHCRNQCTDCLTEVLTISCNCAAQPAAPLFDIQN